jgi:transcriptional regulator with XRE-family HTH domain
MARKELNKKAKDRGITFARRLKDERERKEITQNDLSKMSNVPLDTVRSIENGRISSPGLFIAADLVHALDGRLDEWIFKNKRQRS